MVEFTIIRNTGDRRVLAHVTPEQFTEITRVGGGLYGVPTYRATIEAIRNTADVATQKALKLQLPAALVSCRYAGATAAKNDSFEYVPLMQLDFDLADNEFLNMRDVFYTKKYQLARMGCVFDSPRGGLKVITPVRGNSQNHNQAYTNINRAIKERTGLNGDSNCKGVVRLMYLSFDPACQWIDAVPLTPFAEEFNTQQTAAPAASVVDWETVDTSSVSGMFMGVLAQLEANNIRWRKGGHNEFLISICECKRRGVELEMLLNMVHHHIAGQYRGEYTKEHVTSEVVRFYSNYFGKGIAQSKGLYNGEPVEFKQHLSEHSQMIWEQLQQRKTLYIDAPTGAGKTYMISELARLSGLKIDMIMPTTALAMQQHNPDLNIYSVTGEIALSEEQKKADILATCYESIGKAQQRGARVLVVDEAHELATAYGYRSKAVQLIQQHLAGYDFIIYLSGSMFPILDKDSRANVLRFQPEQPRKIEYSLVNLVGEKDSDFFRATIKIGALNVFYKNDKAELIALAQVLKARGLRVALVSADNKSDDGYTGIVKGSTLVGYDVLLTTSLIQAGVNINDETEVIITFGTGASLMDYIQFSARFRRIIPAVRICHKSELGEVITFNETGNRANLKLISDTYNKIREMNKMIQQGEYSSTRLLDKPDGIFDNGQQYEVDNYFLLSEKYRCDCLNATGNVNVLHNFLQQHGFNHVQQPLETFLIDEELNTARARGKQAQKENVAQAIKKLFAGELVPKLKFEKDIQQRYLTLSKWLERSEIRGNDKLLTNANEYKRRYNQIAYAQCSQTVADGFSLLPATAVRYNKLKALETSVAAGAVVSADELKTKVETIFGRQADNGVVEHVGTIYRIQHKRVRVGEKLGYVYLVGEKHDLPVCAKAITDDEITRLLFAD